MTLRTGRCACGGVRIRIDTEATGLHACHCNTCRRISGSASMTLVVPFAAMTVESARTVSTFVSSDWASRSFCNRCGAGLWYRLTTPDAATADYYLSAGLLDDVSGLELDEEIFIDRKPQAYGFAGQHPRLTGAEFEARLSTTPEE